MKAFTAVVRGEVQGVGFRYFAERVAHENSILGWVRNQADGSVEVMAAGADEDLERFLREIKRGPHACHVESIDLVWLTDVPHVRGFTITG